MNDQKKTRQDLLAELDQLRRQVGELQEQLTRTQQGEVNRAVESASGQDLAAPTRSEADRNRPEETVQPSDQRMRLHAEQTPLAVIEWDLQFRVVKWNPAAERIFGYTHDEALGRHFSFIIPPDVCEHVDRVWSALLAKKGGERSTNENVTKDGNRILCEWYNTPLVDAEGQVVGFASLAQDITDRKRTEDALRESERRLSTLLSNLPGAVYRIKADSEWTVELLSDGYLPLTGYDPSQLIGRSGIRHSERIHPEDREREVEVMQQAVAQKRHFQVEYRLRTAAGEEKWLWEQGTGVFASSGELEAIEGFTTDITERKRAEEGLAESKAILQAVIESIPFDFFALDPEGRYILQNATSKTYWGDVTGKRPEELGLDGATLSLWLENNRRAFAGERVEDDVDFPVRGERRFFRNVLAPIRDGERIYGILGVNVDITDRIRAEQELQQANEHLEERVRERTAGLAEAYQHLLEEVEQRREAEDALRQNEAKYRALIESCPDAVAMVDLQGQVVFASPQAAEQLGFSHPNEMLGRQATEFVVEEDRDKFQRNERRLLDEGVRRDDEYRWLRRDGTIFEAEISAAVIRDADGNPEAMMGIMRDITDRKRAEEKLAMFRRFAESATQGFRMADVEGQILYANPFLARLFGAQSPEEVIGTQVISYYPADYAVRREHEIIPALRRNKQWRGEQLVRFPDGQMHPTIHTVFPVHDENGELLCTAAVITDITELRQTEHALRESYEELRTIYECTVDGLLIADIETKAFANANRAICQMLGYSREELLTMSVRDIHPREALPAVLTVFQSQAEGVFLRADGLPVLRKDGSVFYADVTSNSIIYNGRPCLIGFFRDETERRRARQALAESEEKYRHLVETTDTGYLILDEQGRVLDANAEYVRLSGHDTLGEILGRSVTEWTAPRDAKRNVREVQRCLKQGSVRQLEIDYIRGDGTVTPVEINASVVETSQGRRIVSLCRDITERKQAEEKLQAEQRALRRTMQAGDRERSLITFELHDGVAQQLMGAMLHFQSQEFAKRQKPKGDDPFHEGMDALRRASSELRRVMNWLRTPVLEKYGLTEAIGDVASQLRLTPDAPEIEYRHDVQFKRLEPMLENSLFRIAQEALTNACRHSRSKKVRVTLVQKGDKVTLEVRDWGIGFDQGTVQENRFGLEGVRERARILGGKLSIKSEPGRGTVIRVTFPVMEATA